MKRLLIAATTLALLGGTALSVPAMAQPYHGQPQAQQRHNAPPPRNNHRWNKGQRAPVNYRNRSHYVDYRSHHLRQPPRGYQWVKADDSNQFLMVALATGLIAAIANN